MSHKSGHVIVSFALPHDDEDEESGKTSRLRREPSVFVEAEGPCTEDDCAELARLAYRKLVRGV
jgi:hypothetical protein